MKEIKDYLHLYLCAEYIQGDETGKVSAIDFDRLSRSNSAIDIKLILRPLSDMTEEEGKEYVALGFGGLPDQRGGKLIYKTFTPSCFIWLLSKHFDLFGLIESGLAIDKTKTNL